MGARWEPSARTNDTPAPPPLAANRGKLIEVQAIPAGEARQVLNKASVVMGNVATLSILAVFFASIAGLVGAVYFSNLIDAFRHGAASPLTAVPGFTLAAVCLVLFIFSAYVGTKNSGVAGNRYYRSRSRKSIALRLDKWVDPDRPADLETHFVGIVPRQNWGKLMMELATDIGFMQIDPRRQEIRFEGDVERYRIPISAITNCQMVCYFSTSGRSSLEYWAVVVQGNTASGAWEAPIAPRVTKWIVPPGSQRTAATNLHAELTALLPEISEGPHPPPLPSYLAKG